METFFFNVQKKTRSTSVRLKFYLIIPFTKVWQSRRNRVRSHPRKKPNQNQYREINPPVSLQWKTEIERASPKQSTSIMTVKLEIKMTATTVRSQLEPVSRSKARSTRSRSTTSLTRMTLVVKTTTALIDLTHLWGQIKCVTTETEQVYRYPGNYKQFSSSRVRTMSLRGSPTVSTTPTEALIYRPTAATKGCCTTKTQSDIVRICVTS